MMVMPEVQGLLSVMSLLCQTSWQLMPTLVWDLLGQVIPRSVLMDS